MSLAKYRSNQERIFHAQFPDLPYEKRKWSYVSNHTYTPDFNLGPNMEVEVKGRFLSSDRAKHLLLKQQNPALKVLFVFQNPNLPITKQSKTTCAEWCNNHNFKWMSIQDIDSYDTAGLISLLNGTTVRPVKPNAIKALFSSRKLPAGMM